MEALIRSETALAKARDICDAASKAFEEQSSRRTTTMHGDTPHTPLRKLVIPIMLCHKHPQHTHKNTTTPDPAHPTSPDPTRPHPTHIHVYYISLTSGNAATYSNVAPYVY